MLNPEDKRIITSQLRKHNADLIALFGSYARGDNKSSSDLDILVRFKKVVSLLQLIGIENQLSDQLGVKVDLITENAITNSKIKDQIYKDIKILYQNEG